MVSCLQSRGVVRCPLWLRVLRGSLTVEVSAVAVLEALSSSDWESACRARRASWAQPGPCSSWWGPSWYCIRTHHEEFSHFVVHVHIAAGEIQTYIGIDHITCWRIILWKLSRRIMLPRYKSRTIQVLCSLRSMWIGNYRLTRIAHRALTNVIMLFIASTLCLK